MSKVKKYLLYALLILVILFVGAIINLQVSNWNEARKKAHEENIGLNEPYLYQLGNGIINFTAAIKET